MKYDDDVKQDDEAGVSDDALEETLDETDDDDMDDVGDEDSEKEWE